MGRDRPVMPTIYSQVLGTVVLPMTAAIGLINGLALLKIPPRQSRPGGARQ